MLSATMPQELIDELITLPNYVFDLSTARLSSYECWHILGKHVTFTEAPIMARVSPSERSLRLEQEFTIVKHMLKIDRTGTRVIRALEFFHLTKTKAVVSIYEPLGKDSIPEFTTAMHTTQVLNVNNEMESTPKGIPSTRVITLPQFLDFAIGACECLEILHQSHQLVHGEVRDDAFFYNSETRTVKIMQFGSSTRSVQSSLGSDSFQDTFEHSALDFRYVYLSPEQTGRTSTTVDQRTDIYSLGIVFFSILTSQLPFYGTALDILHSILHKPIPSMDAVRPDIPHVLNTILQKMTAKQAMERYLSSAGLKHDLLELQRRVRECDGNTIEDFPLGEHDVSSVFVLPREIIGRNADTELILNIIRKFVRRRSSPSSTGAKRVGVTSQQSDFTISSAQDALSLSDKRSRSTSSEKSSPSRGSREASSSNVSRQNIHSRRNRRAQTEVIVVRGFAGVGKTALVNSLRAPIRSYGYYAKARVRERSRKPFEALSEILSSLLRQILCEREDVVLQFYTNLRLRLSVQWHNVSKFAALVPELNALLEIEKAQVKRASRGQELLHDDDGASQTSSSSGIIADAYTDTFDGASQSSRSSNQLRRHSVGPLSDVVKFACNEALQNSTGNKMLYASFILSSLRVISEMFIATMVIGDIQHADNDMAELLLSVIQSKIDMIVVITQRDGEKVPQAYADFLESDYPRLTRMILKPLNRSAVDLYVANTMHRKPEEVSELSKVLYDKVKGNPFYLGELLTFLHRNNAIRFDLLHMQWIHSDLSSIDQLYRQFAVDAELDQDFISRRLRDLPKRTRNFLIWAAFLGSPFSFRYVQKLMLMPDGLSSSDSNEGLDVNTTALTLVESNDKAMSSLQSLLQAGFITQAEDSDHFNFVHDRYNRAALTLVRPENVATMNLLIAQVLMKDEDHDPYQVCEHLMIAIPLIKDKEYRAPYRKELLQAAKIATDNGSFVRAVELYKAGMELLQENKWTEGASDVDFNETYEFYYRLSNVYAWQGLITEALVPFTELTAQIRTPEHIGQCALLEARVCLLQGEHGLVCEKVIKTFAALEMSDTLRIDELVIRDRFWEFHRLVENSTEAELLYPKPLTDSKMTVASQLLAEACMSSYLGSPDKFVTVTLAFFNLQMNIGADERLCLAYIYLAIFAITRFKLYHFADKLRRISWKLISQCQDSGVIAHATYAYFVYLDHFSSHMAAALPRIDGAIAHAITAGDRPAMLQLQAQNIRVRFFMLENLGSVLDLCDSTLDATNKCYDNSDPIITIRSIRQTVLALMGRTASSDPVNLLTDDEHDSVAYREALLSRPFVATTAVYLEFYMIALFFFGHYEKILELSSHLKWSEMAPFQCSRATMYARFITSLAMISLLRQGNADAEKTELYKARIKENQISLEEWSSVSNVNYYLCWSIVDMGFEDLTGNYDKAMMRYESALVHGQTHHFKLELGLLYVLAGAMCIRRKINSIGRSMLRQSASVFSDCGAIAVTEALVRLYPDSFAETESSRYRSFGVQTTPVSIHAGLQTEMDGLPSTDGPIRQAAISVVVHPPERPVGVGTDWEESENKELSSGSQTLDILDLTSIIKSGQIISSEINVDTLLKKMIEIFISTTRAEISAVIVHEDSKFRVAAMGTVDEVQSFKYPRMTLESLESSIFTTAISYALNTSETVFMTNSAEDERFVGTGKSWLQMHPDGRSVLVHPVRHKNIVLGALYLEGSPNSFNTRHIEVLSLLSQQMGISITNAMLFKNIRKATLANAMMIESQTAALRAARESEARFVATLETMPCIIWTADPPTEEALDSIPPIDYMNNFWYIFCGSEAPSPANNAYLEQFHSEDRDVFVNALRNAARGTYEPIEVRIRDSDGHYRWHVCRGTALKNDEGEITKWIGALIDIDNQRRAQEDAMKAMRLKEEASRMKSEFLANMSHEIRTPIAGVIGMSDLLLNTELQEHQRQFAENIRLCADALLTVITDVLDFSKIEVGKMELDFAPFDVCKVLKETLNILSFPVAKKGLRLIDDIQFSKTPMPIVMGDSGRFRQIAMNLLANAVKFTRSGCITLSARDGYETDESIEIIVYISDTGIGISPQVMSKLFLPFEQGDNSTARQFGGTGLGLSISKNLVELMHGEISLESEYGKGTVAKFSVPLEKAPPGTLESPTSPSDAAVVAWDNTRSSFLNLGIMPSPTSPPMDDHSSSALDSSLSPVGAYTKKPPLQKRSSTSGSSASSGSADSMQSHSGETTISAISSPTGEKATWILVVEDNLINQHIALNILRKLKYNVEAVFNGQEALVALDRRLETPSPFDLILMDCQMPLMDGYEATRRIRQHYHQRLRDIPVIAMTANAVAGDREKCLEAGMSDYLAKPVKGKVLEVMIGKWLGNPGVA